MSDPPTVHNTVKRQSALRRSHRRSVGWLTQMIPPQGTPRRVLASLNNVLHSVRTSNHNHPHRVGRWKIQKVKGSSGDGSTEGDEDDCTYIPAIFCDCIKYLRKFGLQTEGIFRIPGDQEKVQQLKERFDNGEDSFLDENTLCDVHDVATLFKLHIAEFPLIPAPYYRQMQSLWDTIQEQSSEQKAAALANATKRLPIGLRARLGLLLQFLYIVSHLSTINKMSTEALSVVFAPVVFVAPEDTPLEDMLKENEVAIAASRLLIENAELVQVPDEVLSDILHRSHSVSTVSTTPSGVASGNSDST